MQPNSRRRVHGVEFKKRVLAECRQPGASVAAVSLSHGLNVNLVRKWLIGRGLKRSGLLGPADDGAPSLPVETSPGPMAMRFVPVELAGASLVGGEDSVSAAAAETGPGLVTAPQPIQIDLRRGATQLSVRWPLSEATACAAWLREVVVVSGLK